MLMSVKVAFYNATDRREAAAICYIMTSNYSLSLITVKAKGAWFKLYEEVASDLGRLRGLPTYKFSTQVATHVLGFI